MTYLLLLFFILFFCKRDQPVFHSLVITLTIFPAIYYLLNILGIKVISVYYADLFFLVLFAGFLLYRGFHFIKHAYQKEKSLFSICFLLTAVFIGVSYLFFDSFTLPGCDPVGVPTYAKLIFNEGNLPIPEGPVKDYIYIYPPGFSIFIAIFYYLIDPLYVLLLFKWINIIVISFAPALWAYYFRKIFGINHINYVFIALAFYFGYFVFDRVNLWGLAYAGKNALFYFSCLFPAVYYSFFKDNKTISDTLIVMLSILGMILIHYSFIYMFLLVVVSHSLIDFNKVKKEAVKLVMILAVSFALFVPMYLSLKNSSIISSSGFDSPLNIINRLGMVFKMPNFWFWPYYPIVKWPFKFVVVLLTFLIPTLFIIKHKNTSPYRLCNNEANLYTPIAIFSLSLIGGIVLSCTLGNSDGELGASHVVVMLDMIRWFLYNFTASLCAASIIFISSTLIKKRNSFFLKYFIALFFIVITIVVIRYDFKELKRWANFRQTTFMEIKNLQDVLKDLSKEESCMLITQSKSEFVHFIQSYKPLEYFIVLSDCTIINGSWYTHPAEHSRGIINLPSNTFFETASEKTFYFIGKRDVFEEYITHLQGMSYEEIETKLKKVAVFKLTSL